MFRFKMLSLSYYVQHFLPFSFAEAASERRFFRGCSGGARLSNSDASVRKASSTLSALLAEVSRKGHASASAFCRASSVDTARPGASDLLPNISLQQSSEACLLTSANHSETWSKDSRCVMGRAHRRRIGPEPERLRATSKYEWSRGFSPAALGRPGALRINPRKICDRGPAPLHEAEQDAQRIITPDERRFAVEASRSARTGVPGVSWLRSCANCDARCRSRNSLGVGGWSR